MSDSINSTKSTSPISFQRYWADVLPYPQADGFYKYYIYKGVVNPLLICEGKRKAATPEEIKADLETTVVKRLNENRVKTFAEANADFMTLTDKK